MGHPGKSDLPKADPEHSLFDKIFATAPTANTG